MAFDLKDLLNVVRDEAAAYGEWFTSALSSPAYIARQASTWSTRSADGTLPPSAGQFYVILVICAFIGASIGAIIPGRPEFKDRLTAAFVVVLAWYLISLLTHGMIRAFGSKASAGSTVRAMMQLLAMVYVASNFVALLVVSLAGMLPHHAFSTRILQNPGDLIVIAQVVLLLFYVPATMHKVHGLGAVRGCATGLFGCLFAVVIAVLLIGARTC